MSFQYTKIAKSFKAAAQRCAADGAHLASVPNVFVSCSPCNIRDLSRRMNTFTDCWMTILHGLGWVALQEQNQTATGTVEWPIQPAVTIILLVTGLPYKLYSSLATGGNSSTNCVYMRSDSTWSFDVCSTSKSFVCELPESTCNLH